jgi:Ca2+-binding RTX toxin-like protein
MVVHSLENKRLVTTVQGYDADPLRSLSYGISGGEDAALFRIDRTTGKLTFKAAPDFELPADADGDNIYSVRVTVGDGLKSTTEEIKVIVHDVANERLVGSIGDDYLLGSAGNDFLKGRSGTDDLYGEDGDDVLDGGAGVDHMEGGQGNDTFIVDNVLDHTHEHADEGIDTVRSSVSFTLDDDVENLILTGKAAIGGAGNELANRMIGNSSANFLRGGEGDDRLLGNGGDDTLIGGSGKDVLYGGAGRDIFRFDYCPAGNREADKILDFSMSDHDVLQITRSGFSGFDHTGALLPDEFYAVPGNMLAHDSTDRLIYDPTSGKLFYDNDGTGQADAVLLGIISSNSNGTMRAMLHPNLTYADFFIIS